MVKIKCRPLALIRKFSEYVVRNFLGIEILSLQKQLLKEARDTLLPRLMTGMIDVDEIELPYISERRCMMVMYSVEKIMHRTQLYFDEELFEQVKQQSSGMGLSVSAYIREAVRKELEREKAASQPVDFSGFSGMWSDNDVTQQSLRSKAWE